MRMISPDGCEISCSDEKGEVLLRLGYRRVQAQPASPAPVRKPRRPKTDS